MLMCGRKKSRAWWPSDVSFFLSSLFDWRSWELHRNILYVYILKYNPIYHRYMYMYIHDRPAYTYFAIKIKHHTHRVRLLWVCWWPWFRDLQWSDEVFPETWLWKKTFYHYLICLLYNNLTNIVVKLTQFRLSMWWFQIFYMFTPTRGNNSIIFQMGWFNHQPVILTPSKIFQTIPTVDFFESPGCSWWTFSVVCPAPRVCG